jgi:hypothetical protein
MKKLNEPRIIIPRIARSYKNSGTVRVRGIETGFVQTSNHEQVAHPGSDAAFYSLI